MALNMSDPAAVMSVYSSILDNENNWLLLHYINDSHDELGLYSYGCQGLEELKTKLPDLNRVFIAFYHEEESDVSPGYIIINYVPPAVSGVRRARALVHSRRVGTIFNKHQTIFTVDSLSLITTQNVHEAIINPDTAFQPAPAISIPNKLPQEQGDPVNTTPLQPLRPLQPVRAPVAVFSQLADATNKPLQEQLDSNNTTSLEASRPFQPVRAPTKPTVKPISTQDMARRSFGATYAPEVEPPNIPPVPTLPKGGGGSMFTNFLRRKKDMDDSLPPPTPPKDKTMYNVPPVGLSHSSPPPFSTNRTVRHQRSRSLSDYAIVSHVRGSDEVVIEPDHFEFAPPPPLQGKWSQRGGRPSDPAERARRRRELRLQREQEEQEVLEQEAERQERARREKEDFERKEVEEDARRKAEVEREIRRITAERKRREHLEKLEEERHHQELEDRKRQDREKRLEEHRRLEEWRNEQARKAEAAALLIEEKKKKEEMERRRKIQQAEAKVKGNKVESELTGWVTVQSKDGLSWKRRYYRFAGNTIFLYRSPKDLTTSLEQVELRGKLRCLKEWHEGYDDLEAISFSFVVEFKDNEHWSMYADSEEEKYKVLGLFKITAGL